VTIDGVTLWVHETKGDKVATVEVLASKNVEGVAVEGRLLATDPRCRRLGKEGSCRKACGAG
jgi:hypothetical protein